MCFTSHLLLFSSIFGISFFFFSMTDTRLIHKFPKLSPFRLKFSRLGLSPGASMALFRLRNRGSYKKCLVYSKEKKKVLKPLKKTIL